VAAGLVKDEFAVVRQQITIPKVIKELGLHPATVQLHSDVVVNVRINVALSVEEAHAQLQTANKIAGKSYGSEKAVESADAETSEETA